MSIHERTEYYRDIHALAHQLGMDDHSYRQMLFSLTGFKSCVDLRPTELKEVLRFLRVEAGIAYNPDELISDDEALAVLA